MTKKLAARRRRLALGRADDKIDSSGRQGMPGMSADDDKPRDSLLAEFKRRRVVQVAIAYCLVAWLIVQISDVLLPAYGAPDWALQATVTILIVAFPPALVLAWLYNLTASGIELTSGARWSATLRNPWLRFAISSVTVVLTGAAVWWVWHAYVEEQRAWIQLVDNSKTRVVAVAPVRNLSGKSELDWLGDGLSNLVRDRLAQSRHLVLVSGPRWQSIAGDATDPSDTLERAARAGVDFLVSGEILSAPSGLILTTRVTSTRNGADLASEAAENLSAEQVLGAVYRISIMAKQALKVPHEEQVDSFAADFAINNFAAYRAYVSGLQFFLNFDYDEAKQSMKAALELAPDFHIARYRLAMLHWVMSERDQAADAMRQIPEDTELNERERGYVDAANAFIRDNDPGAAIGLYNELLDKFPYEVEARQYLAEAYFHDYQDEAAIAELRLLGEQEPENQFVWGSLGAYLTILGQLEEALPPLQRYLEIAPDEPNAHNLLGDLYRERGEFDLAIGYFEKALELEPDFTLSQLGLAEVKAAQGELGEAKQRLRAVIDNADNEAEDRITAAFDLAWLLRAEGHFVASTEAIDQVSDHLDAEGIRVSMALALKAENALQLGNAAEAAELIDTAVGKSVRAPTRYLFARARMELEQERLDEVQATIAEIRRHALPPDDPDRTEDRTALFVEGLSALRTGDAPAAVDKIRSAIDMNGYRYAIYERALAEALHATGQLNAAIAMAAKAKRERDSGNLRLDLERERALAHRLEIKLVQESGDLARAGELIDAYVQYWGRAELGEPGDVADRRSRPAADLVDSRD